MSDSTDPIADFEKEEAFLTNTFGDRYLYSVNRQLFDNQDAEAVYQDYLPDLIRQTNSLFVVVGTDSGLLIEHIAKHGAPSGSRYLFVELDGVLEQVVQKVKHLLNESIILTNLEQWLNKAESLEYKNYLYMNHVYVIQSLGSIHAYLPMYLELSRVITAETTSWEWFLRQQYASTKFIENQLANATENQIPLSALENSFQGKTAVLIASGPSLDKLLPWIVENRHKILIVAISRSARRLIEAGLKPDIVFTIDPYPISFQVSKEMLALDPSVLLVNSHQAQPQLISQWHGPNVYLGSLLPWKEEADNPYKGITVTNAAIEALLTLGISQIILAGVDLCFSPDGSFYSAGTIESDAGPVLGYIGPMVETNDGHRAETSDGYLQGIKNLAEQATRANELECTLINPAPSAAKIPNVEHRLLENIALDPLTETPSRIFSSKLPAKDKQYRLNHYQKLDKELLRFSLHLEKMYTLIKDILRSLDILFGRNGNKQNLKYKDKIIKIENQLENKFSDELKLAKQYAIKEFLQYLGRSNVGNRSLDEAENDGRSYYTAICDGTKQLIQLINMTRERITSRITEENPTCDFMILWKQWHHYKDNTPGRSLIWQQNNPEAYAALSTEENAMFANEVRRLEKQIQRTDAELVKACQERASLDNIPRKIKLLFAKQDIEGLRTLFYGLTRFHNNEENAQPFINFTAGCLAELEGKEEEAIAHFQLISDGLLLEDALLHISNLCINRGDAPNALLALECLCHISINYVPTYAELAWHAGHIKEAMELFTQYLQQVPTDLKTYIRLGKLYQKQGVTEAARMAFCHVLEQDPGNKTAESLLNSLEDASATAP